MYATHVRQIDSLIPQMAVNKENCSLKHIKPAEIIGIQPPASGNWNIAETTIVRNGRLTINGSIFIRSHGALILKNSTLYMNIKYSGSDWIEVFSEGNFTILNSKITGYPTREYYIKINKNSKFLMDNSEIEYAGADWGVEGDKTGIWINTDNAIIRNSRIHNCYDGLLLFYAYNIKIYNTIFSRCKNNGIYLWYDASAEIYNCTFSWNSWGILVNGYASAEIHNNTFNGNDNGIRLGYSVGLSGNVTIYNNTLIYSAYEGIHLNPHTNNSKIYYNNFIENLRAFVVDEGCVDNVFILNNFIDNHYKSLDKSASIFDNGVVGNYWSEYDGHDNDNDGIGDDPYTIDEDSIDHHPLMKPTYLGEYEIGNLEELQSSQEPDSNMQDLFILLITALVGSTLVITLVIKRKSIFRQEKHRNLKTKKIVETKEESKSIDFDKIYKEIISDRNINIENVLNSVEKSKRKIFGRWLAEKLISDARYRDAKDILIKIEDYDRAVPLIISMALRSRSEGKLDDAKKLYLEAADILKKKGDLERAKSLIKESEKM